MSVVCVKPISTHIHTHIHVNNIENRINVSVYVHTSHMYVYMYILLNVTRLFTLSNSKVYWDCIILKSKALSFLFQQEAQRMTLSERPHF